MEIHAIGISAQLIARLKEGKSYKIHSRFSHGLNLEIDGRLSFIGNKQNEILPYGVLIPQEEIPKLALLQEERFFWRNGIFFTKHSFLDIKQVGVYSNTLPAFFVLSETGKRKCHESMLILSSYSELDTRFTGFSNTIRKTACIEGDSKRKLAKAIVTGEHIDKVLKNWIGFGIGLTPSGDDFLTGILAANFLYGFANEKLREAIKRCVEQGYTTDIGKNQLLCAVEGLFGKSWIQFLNAFYKVDEVGMKMNFYRILSYGHTSGSDMFSGFCMGLNIVKQGGIT